MPIIPEHLREGLQGVWDGFSARLEEIPYEWREEGLTVDGKFFFVAFRDGQPTLDEFIEYVYGQIIPFCIPKRVRDDARRRFLETNNHAYLQSLSDQARHLFVQARGSRSTAGEIGELILFMLLEAALGAPQLVCKMTLKTSQDMPVHGSDGIHIMIGSTPDKIRLLWGESKIYQSLASALDEVCTSITEFIGRSSTRPAIKRDLDIIRDHAISTGNPALVESILEHFDPYSSKYNQREEAFACFVGFDYSAFNQLSSLSHDDVSRVFRENYLERIGSACTLFGDKLRSAGLERQRVYFFLIPFADVAELRTKFLAKLGVAP